MKYFGSLGTFLLVLSTLLFLTKAWSSEIVSKQPVSGSPLGVEAIVTEVAQTSLTLKPTSPDRSEFSIIRPDDGNFHVGDRVVLQGETLKKLGGRPAEGTPQESIKKSPDQAAPATLPPVPSEPVPAVNKKP